MNEENKESGEEMSSEEIKKMEHERRLLEKANEYQGVNIPYKKQYGTLPDGSYGLINPITEHNPYNNQNRNTRAMRRGRERIVISPDTLTVTHFRKTKNGNWIRS